MGAYKQDAVVVIQLGAYIHRVLTFYGCLLSRFYGIPHCYLPCLPEFSYSIQLRQWRVRMRHQFTKMLYLQQTLMSNLKHLKNVLIKTGTPAFVVT